MTAEVAIFNRNAIALAADSAVTLQLPESSKIYICNKLFSLSKYDPVGIMVFGNADFMDVPWETVIKRYRSHLGTRSFGQVAEYGADFLKFIEHNTDYFPTESQESYCYEAAAGWLRRLKSRLRTAVEFELQANKKITDARVKQLFASIVTKEIAHLRRHAVLQRFATVPASSLLKKYKGILHQAIAAELQKLVGAVPSGALETGCILAIMRDAYWNSDSGVVVAGYGDKQFLPSLRSYKLDAIIGGRLRVIEEKKRSGDITSTTRSAILAFAQSEMVALFMNGVDTEYVSFIGSSMHRILVEGYPTLLDSVLQKLLANGPRKRVVEKLRKAGDKILDALAQAVSGYSRKVHWEPIVQIVAHLPKEELAAMAEALVNLTSFKRHITRDAETVGGPIDVAIISRGDGFVWIKRKHYFEPSLNPQFFSRYYYDVEKKVLR